MLGTTSMAQQRPPTPPPIGTELHYDLQQFMQQASHSAYDFEDVDGHYLHSGHASAYGTPEPMAQDAYLVSQYNQNQYAGLQQSAVGLGIQYNAYSGALPGFHQSDNQSFTSSPYMASGSLAGPPTPRSQANSDIGRRTRSGRTIPSTNDKSRVTKSLPKPKKPKANRSDKAKTPKLTAPLSILTKDMTVPVKDMEAWANRPVEVRRKEVEKRGGYVTRPMNSFMLYRSAFAERTKQWCLQNNHQVVSSVSGESWPMEPEEVRERFNELAKLERINHQNAHPDYKFSPSKAGASRKRKSGDSDDDDSDFDDPDWGRSHGKSRPASSRKPREISFETPQPYTVHTGTSRSAWEFGIEGQPMTTQLSQPSAHQQYYGGAIEQNWQTQQVDHIRMATNDLAPFDHGQSLIGLPGGEHNELLEPHATAQLALEPQLDPTLLQFDQTHFDARIGGLVGDSAYEAYSTQEWHADPNMGPGLETGTEFDKWMD